MIRTLSAAHRASLRRIVENSKSSAYAFLRLFDRLTETYLAGVTWQPRAEMEALATALLPALLLGRIDGKSPIEYVTEEREKNQVRDFARRYIATRVDRLDAAAGVPLYAYLLGDRPAIMPIPEVQIFGGESTDDGRTWQSAILGENLGKYSFREWKIPVRLTLTSFRRRDEMNGIGLLASIPRFLRKGVGDHGIFEKQPHAK